MSHTTNRAGPNAKRVGLHFASLRAIPEGGCIADGIRWFRDPDKMKRDLAAGQEDAQAAIQAVKNAPDNPFGDDDEAIAGELLHRIEIAKAERVDYLWAKKEGE